MQDTEHRVPRQFITGMAGVKRAGDGATRPRSELMEIQDV